MSSLKYLREIADRLGLRWLRAHKPDLSSVRSRLRLPALSRWQWGVLLGFGAVLLLFVLFVAVDGGLYYNQTHYGVRVAGQDLGGLSRDEATAALTTFVQETRSRPIVLTTGDESWEVLPGDVGTTIDIAASVSAATDLTRDGDVFSIWGDGSSSTSVVVTCLCGAPSMATSWTSWSDELAAELDRRPSNARMDRGRRPDHHSRREAGRRRRQAGAVRAARGPSLHAGRHRAADPHDHRSAGHRRSGHQSGPRGSEHHDQLRARAHARR